jgi:hypothetical protein
MSGGAAMALAATVLGKHEGHDFNAVRLYLQSNKVSYTDILASRLLGYRRYADDDEALPLRDQVASAQRVDVGKGELAVNISVDGPGHVNRIKSGFEGNLGVNAGIDMTGRRLWRPTPYSGGRAVS